MLKDTSFSLIHKQDVLITLSQTMNFIRLTRDTVPELQKDSEEALDALNKIAIKVEQDDSKLFSEQMKAIEVNKLND